MDNIIKSSELRKNIKKYLDLVDKDEDVIIVRSKYSNNLYKLSKFKIPKVNSKEEEIITLPLKK